MPNDERIYSQSEIIQILEGLCNVYWSKPWYLKVFYKPWFDALTTAIIIIGGDKVVNDILEEAYFADLSDQLDED